MGLDAIDRAAVAVEDVAPGDDVPPGSLERSGELVRLARVSALEVEDDRRRRKRVQRLLKRGDRALLLAPEREGLPAVGRVAIARIELLQLGHGLVADLALALRAAIEGPVVEYGDLPSLVGAMSISTTSAPICRAACIERVVFSR